MTDPRQVNSHQARPRLVVRGKRGEPVARFPWFAADPVPGELRYNAFYDVKTWTYCCDRCLDDHGRGLVLVDYEYEHPDGLTEMGYECARCGRWWWSVRGYYDGRE